MCRMTGIGLSAASSIEQDGENDPQLRSRSFERLNVPTAYASAFKLPAASHGERRVSARRGWVGENDDRFDRPAPSPSPI
jgi:hypothetical protein